jgi:hypothetical protein
MQTYNPDEVELTVRLDEDAELGTYRTHCFLGATLPGSETTLVTLHTSFEITK